jgi:hypothetical protein
MQTFRVDHLKLILPCGFDWFSISLQIVQRTVVILQVNRPSDRRQFGEHVLSVATVSSSLEWRHKYANKDGETGSQSTRLSHPKCNRTDQIIRAKVQKQAPKRLNFRTWAHIIPVVNRNHEGFQTNSLTTRIASFNIQHHTYHFTSSAEISLHKRSSNYYKPSLKVAEA